MNKIVYILASMFLSLTATQDHVCLTYFTQIGCQGCAQSDPQVLYRWLKEMPHLVVIEYAINGSAYEKDNQYVFVEYAKKFDRLSVVPQAAFGDKGAIGPVEILPLQGQLQRLDEAKCTLLDEEFDEMDLNKLPGFPRIFWHDRVLLKVGKGFVESNYLRGLLFDPGVESVMKEKRIEAQALQLSDNEITFERAYQISEDWILQVGAKLRKESFESAPKIKIPFIGEINHEHSLIVLTVLLGLADGFNPCAFFILTFLLASMLYAATDIIDKKRKRNRVLLVGLTFVFFSALIYFLFMGLWFNAFKFLDQAKWLTWLAGGIALFAGFINIKDYFFFQKGFSCTLPKSEKLKFVGKVEALKCIHSWYGLLLGTIVIAITVNLYELLCTLGIPMIYLRLLTLNQLSLFAYYAYLGLYCLTYIFPVLIIVLVFAFTLGAKEFSLQNVKRLKLISGLMVLLLGLILLIKPALLKSGTISVGLIVVAVVVAFIIMLIYEHGFAKRD